MSWNCSLVLLIGVAIAPVPLTAQVPAARDTALPRTGLDFSGVDRFWKIADILTADREPTPDQWRALLSTPGYRLAIQNLGPHIQDDIDLALRPARHREFLRATAAGDDHAVALQHIALAWARRAELVAYRDSLARGTPIAEAVARAATLLPPGATRKGAPPLVTFAIFRDDAYSLPPGIVVDLLYSRVLSIGGTSLATTLAHEFHHSYVNRMSRTPRGSGMSSGEGALRDALYDLRNEGLADLIDKPYPFRSPDPGLAAYAVRYNAEYVRTPVVIRGLDSLLAVAPGGVDAAGDRAMGLFWANGHPNGAYIAREILETFGVDSLFPAARSPAAFLRTFAAAERKRGRADPFSPPARRELDTLDQHFWTR